ncbi:MAG: hypothetical protein IPJ30_10760 [Acidobacteria bacterium]|nr:hypothetical protein [Acidobacteriota bacterium]
MRFSRRVLGAVQHSVSSYDAEAAVEVRRVLKPDGVVIFNIGGALTGDGSRFFRAELATYREVFPDVQVFKVRPETR